MLWLMVWTFTQLQKSINMFFYKGKLKFITFHRLPELIIFSTWKWILVLFNIQLSKFTDCLIRIHQSGVCLPSLKKHLGSSLSCRFLGYVGKKLVSLGDWKLKNTDFSQKSKPQIGVFEYIFWRKLARYLSRLLGNFLFHFKNISFTKVCLTVFDTSKCLCFISVYWVQLVS